MAFTLKSTARLPSGHQIPLLGLGVYQNYDARSSVLQALDAGYRHIDSAQAYRNEEAVGQGVAQASIKREDLFVSKEHSVGWYLPRLWKRLIVTPWFFFFSLASKVTGRNQGYKSALQSVDKSLERFGLREIYHPLSCHSVRRIWAETSMRA